jgi:polyisoprenoid-binding protein YceI
MKQHRNFLFTALAAAFFAALLMVTISGSFTTSAANGPDAVKYLPITSGTYSFDPNHTVIGFGVKHLEIAIVEGRFKDFTGSVNFDDKDITKSSVSFTAKIASIDTGVEPRNKHLRTADFFDADKYPEMTFQSTQVSKKGKGYQMTGDLTIKGVTKRVTFPFTITGAVKDPWGGTRFGIEAETVINRRDFGINYGNALPMGGFDVANSVSVGLHIEAVKK